MSINKSIKRIKMKSSKYTLRKIACFSIVSAVTILAPSSASASLLQSGSATINLDAAAWLAQPSGHTIRGVYTKADMASMSADDIINAPSGTPSTTGLVFDMYGSAPLAGAGRAPQETTFDYTGNLSTSANRIGLGGAFKTTGTGFAGQVAYGDFGLEQFSGVWKLTNNLSFPLDLFNLVDVVTVENADSFTLTADLKAGAFAANFLGLNTTDVLGDISFTGSTVSAVPVPAAVWLFGTGLIGLVGAGKRKKLQAV